MTGSYRTVALQAVGVAVIAGFIFIAFLRPSEPEELAGVDAPGGDGPSVVSPPAIKKGHHKGEKRDGDEDLPRESRSSLAAAAGSGAGGIGASDAAGGDGILTPPGGDNGPGDDQYTDLVSLLMKQVGKPELYKEIDDP